MEAFWLSQNIYIYMYLNIYSIYSYKNMQPHTGSTTYNSWLHSPWGEIEGSIQESVLRLFRKSRFRWNGWGKARGLEKEREEEL